MAVRCYGTCVPYMEDRNCIFFHISLIIFRMLSEQYVLLIRWCNLLGILKKETVCSAEISVIICQATVSNNSQNRNIKATTVNVLCAILNVNNNLFLHDCTVYVAC